MLAPLTTERQKYHHLYSLVCEDLPTKTVDALVRKGHEATTEELRAVRQSRKPHLAWLIDLIHIGLPDYQIPVLLLPVAPARVGACRRARARPLKAILSPFTAHTFAPQHRPRAGPA